VKKVYFACSIRGGREDALVYGQIVDLINKYGKCLSELFGTEDHPHVDKSLSDAQIYRRDINWLKTADCVIAEVSTPSLGVGYELTKAEEWQIPVLALYRRHPARKLSSMIAGGGKIKVHKYSSVDQLDGVIKDFLATEGV